VVPQVLFLLQMAGAPGSGKSTLARAVAERYDAVVLDYDVVKTALLDADAPWGLAGPGAYNVLYALADELLSSGRSAIIDSPSHYEIMPIRGAAIAAKHHGSYRFIECVCDDTAELRRRLTSRTPRRSQMRDLDQMSPDADGPIPARRVGQHRWQTHGPEGGHLVVDSSAPFDQGLLAAISYIEDAGPRSS
jgi:predicted kinase